MRFKDRQEAGRLLAKALEKYKRQDCVIYALPRGGVVLGVEIAKHLQAPLDLVISRKIGHPFWPEYAVGAVTETGQPVLNQEEIDQLDPEWLKQAVKNERSEARRRRLTYLAGRQPVDVKSMVAIITDDGVATGLTMQAAILDIDKLKPSKIVAALPVIPKDFARLLQSMVDEIIVLETAENYLGSVGAYYQDFGQIEDAEVIKLIKFYSLAKI